jgi:DHA2 family multidrug resistance protein-like MFS transporter
MATEGPRAGRREWLGLAVLAFPALLYSIDLTVLYLAVPSLSRDLEPSSSQLLWITDIYGFLTAAFLIMMGTLGDRIGRRRLLLIGATVFACASVLAAFSTSPEMLIAARALLGVAAATLAPSTLSLITTMFRDEGQRTTAIGLWVTSYSVGAVIGPLIGGLLLEHFWWGSVFLLAVPVMALLLVIGPRVLPEFRDPHPGRFDLTSAILSLLSVLSVVYGIKRMAEGGGGPAASIAVAVGLAVGAVFLRRQARLKDPMIDLRLFRAPPFSTSLAANALAILVVFGMDLFIVQYLQLVHGMGPFTAGLWTLPVAAGFVVGSNLAPVLTRRVSSALAMSGGLVLAGLGLAALTQVQAESGVALLIAGSSVMTVGAGVVVTLSTDLVIGTAPPERAGNASGISETGAELGGALGIALLGSLGTAVYRSDLGEAIPEGASSEPIEAARDTLGGAAEVAERLPQGLFEAASEAFTHGLQVAAATGAGLMLAMAVAAAATLRAVPVAPSDAREPGAAGVPAPVGVAREVDPADPPVHAP